MRRKLVALLSTTLMWLCIPAQAQNAPRFYLGIEGGFYLVEDQTDEIAYAYLDLFGGSVSVRQSNDGVSRLFTGLVVNPNLAIELALLSGRETIDVDGYDDWGTPYSVQAIGTWRGPEVSILLRPAETGFFLRAGFNTLTPKVEAKASTPGFSSTATESGSSKSGTSLGLGYDSAFGESRRHNFRIAYTVMNNEVVDDEGPFGVFSLGYYYVF